MRISWIGVTALVATALAAGPAFANGPAGSAPKVERYAPLSPQDEVVPVVAPGEEIGIACDALQYTAPNNDVRVVLTISATPPADRKLGYKKVLATNEELTKGAVRVRIPEVPELENHTVNVNVYVVNETGSKNCDAGHMRIADGLKHPKRKDS
jgi:hypothetical protein